MVIDIGFMPPDTAEIFNKISQNKFISDYTLVGGTALSIQIKHRQSEDLDFIFDSDEIEINKIKRNIARLFPDYKIIKQDGAYQIDFIINNVRLTFFSTGAVLVPFSVKQYSFSYHSINIAGIEIIAALKLAALAQRNTIRDYYDLYFIAKNFIALEKIIENTKKLFPNLSPVIYTETLTYIDDIEEDNLSSHLNPAENLTKQEISAFFIKELKKIYNSN